MGRFGFIACCLFILVLQADPVSAKVITVGRNHNIKSINKAVNLADSGDIIEVTNGIYNENVVISKPIILRGINFPSINARFVGNVVLVTADNAVVEGFKID